MQNNHKVCVLFAKKLQPDSAAGKFDSEGSGRDMNLCTPISAQEFAASAARPALALPAATNQRSVKGKKTGKRPAIFRDKENLSKIEKRAECGRFAAGAGGGL